MRIETIESTSEESSLKKWRFLLVFIPIFLLVLYWSWLTAPAYQTSQQFEIPSGMSVSEIADAAGAQGLVRSPFLLYATLSLKYDPTNIHAGRYLFTEPLSVFGVARYLASNKTELDLTAVTFPEGISLIEMADIAEEKFANITAEDYLVAANNAEGYLFPETYFLPPSITAADLVDLQKETLNVTIEDLFAATKTPLTLEEVIILASIVEREANDEASMRMVSGIFMNRLDIGMALQADATIEYVLDNKIGDLAPGELAENLREIDSPYNTYIHNGLPPTPIGNPGKMAIEAVLNPQESDYFYYITDDEGNFHYARSLAEHNQNVSQYLR